LWKRFKETAELCTIITMYSIDTPFVTTNPLVTTYFGCTKQPNVNRTLYSRKGPAVAQWLRCCATNRKVAGSIPAGVIRIFHRHKILPIALWPWGRLSF